MRKLQCSAFSYIPSEYVSESNGLPCAMRDATKPNNMLGCAAAEYQIKLVLLEMLRRHEFILAEHL
jgi:hypothetical protein